MRWRLAQSGPRACAGVERLRLRSGAIGFGGTAGAACAPSTHPCYGAAEGASRYTFTGEAEPYAVCGAPATSPHAGATAEELETLKFNMDVQFDTAWDRRALETSRPQPRKISLHLAEAKWGAMRLNVSGDLKMDEAGIPTGSMAFQVEDWQAFLRIGEDTGVIDRDLAQMLQRVFGMLARSGGNEEDLDITLVFRDGYIALGPFPLGPAPRLILR